MISTPWFLRWPDGTATRRFRLYCFCYAGGSAVVFKDWQSRLAPHIEICAIQLPGRGTRFHESPVSSMQELVNVLTELMMKQSQMPFAFFGHSLGALISFELARNLRRKNLPMPKRLWISGCDAVRYRSPPKGMHIMSDAALIDALTDYNGTPPEILAHSELMELLLPMIRADFALAENYVYSGDVALDVPITVLAGKSDDYDSLDQVHGWKEETTADCNIHWFDGDHFFINSEAQAVLDCVSSYLSHHLNEASVMSENKF